MDKQQLADLKNLFVARAQEEIARDMLFMAADLLNIAGGFQDLEMCGAAEPHASVFEPHLLALIDIELAATGRPMLFPRPQPAKSQ